jgi:hypothetical protein
MSEQAVDLRSSWAVLRGRSGVLAVAALLGAMVGLALLYVDPPPFTSSSVVLLPSAAQPGSGKTGGYDAETQVLIATSSEILSRAAEQFKAEELTPEQVGDRVTVDVPAPSILRITAGGPEASDAEDLASAVADSLLAYLKETNGTLSEGRRTQLKDRLETLTKSLRSVNGEIKKASDRIAREGGTSAAGLADAAALSDLTAVRASTVLDVDALKKQLAGEVEGGGGAGATVIQPASQGEQDGYATEVLIHVLGGAAAFALLVALYFMVTNQRDPKLRSRDEIATAVGIPVVASLRARRPRSANGWADLLRTYEPDSADGWALRQLVHVLPDASRELPSGTTLVLVVLSLSDDPGGLAIGPQIARFAATHGIPTQLVAAQQHESATALWAACSRPPKDEGGSTALSVTTVPDSSARVDVSVRVVVLDRHTPEPHRSLTQGGTALLAVSSASATRRNLADAVVAADRIGLTVQGIVVANPDPLDRTTGRLAPLDMPARAASAPIPITGRPGPKGPRPTNDQPRQSHGGQR